MSTIRNVAITGPSLSGKTTLLESMLFAAGAISRKGTVKDGNTVGDSAAEARERSMSTEVSAAHAEVDGTLVNFIDCPGSIEFQAEARNALVGVDAAIVVFEPVVERATTLGPILRFLEQNQIPHFIFINKMDRTATLMRDLVPAMQDVSSTPLLITQVPIRDNDDVTGYVDLITEQSYLYRPGAASEQIETPESARERKDEAREMMLEALADFNDELMMMILEDEVPSTEEIVSELRESFAEARVAPILIGAAEFENGVRRLLDDVVSWTPPPESTAERRGLTDGTRAQILKTFNTQHGGKLSLGRVWSGSIADGETVNGERIGGLYRMQGARQEKISEAGAGEIVAFARLENVRTGDTLVPGNSPPETDNEAPRAALLPRLYGLAIQAERREDEVKMATALQRIHDEDPSLIPEQDLDLNQLVLWGQGDMHLQVAFSRLKNRYGAAVTSDVRQVPYREAIRKPITQHGRFKRQTGGSGMFGDVHINIKPMPRGSGFEFKNSVTGGNIPRQYIPAVENGVKDYLKQGPLGFPVVDVSVEVFDGKHHEVDSNEMSFRLAARVAMTEGMPKCSPVLLEPIMEVVIHGPSTATARIQQLVTSRRGQLLGFENFDGWKAWDTVSAYMPQGEILDLISELRSLTQGVGFFEVAFNRLQELIGREADQIVAERGEQRKTD